MFDPFPIAVLIFVIAPAVILGAAAFMAAATEEPPAERKQDNEP